MTTTNSATFERVSDTELVVTRMFNAPRRLVWKAYTEPDRIARWFGPNGFSTEVLRMDVRPGGTWHFCMRSADWGDSWGIGIYEEVTEPERLVYRDAFSNEQGEVIPPVALVTLAFEDRGEQTLLRSSTVYDSAEDLTKVLEMGMEEGFSQTLDNLEVYLASAEQES